MCVVRFDWEFDSIGFGSSQMIPSQIDTKTSSRSEKKSHLHHLDLE